MLPNWSDFSCLLSQMLCMVDCYKSNHELNIFFITLHFMVMKKLIMNTFVGVLKNIFE